MWGPPSAAAAEAQSSAEAATTSATAAAAATAGRAAIARPPEAAAGVASKRARPLNPREEGGEKWGFKGGEGEQTEAKAAEGNESDRGGGWWVLRALVAEVVGRVVSVASPPSWAGPFHSRARPTYCPKWAASLSFFFLLLFLFSFFRGNG